MLAAFGAAFLVARGVDHGSTARAARAAVTTATAPAVTTHDNPELRSEFTPVHVTLKRKPRPRRRHAVHHSASPAATPAPQTTAPQTTVTSTPQTTTQSAPATPAPVYDPAPVYHPAPVHHSSGGSSHTGSSAGSGTTTIG